MKKHAYLIMAHNEFHMLKKLLAELDDVRNDIFIHIDKKIKYVDLKEISIWAKNSNIFFVRRKNIFLGTYSVARCVLALLKAATAKNYYYYHLINDMNFPLKSQNVIHEFFENSDREYISYYKNGEHGDFFDGKVKYYYPLLRWVGKRDFEGPGKKLRFMRKLKEIHNWLKKLQVNCNIDRTKKYKNVVFYKGDSCFSITHDFALYILSKERYIGRIFRFTEDSGEFVVPTLALNSSFRNRVENDSLRHIDWDKGIEYEFKLEDFRELKESRALFAGRISYNNEPLLVEKIMHYIHGKLKYDYAPLISVIVPCYNVADYLKSCVDSLVCQTYSNLEILLIDDGSNDETGIIAREYADRYDTIQYHYRENGGLSAARNTGIRLAKGKYIAFVDSDDWVDSQYIEKLYRALLNGCADIAMCGYCREEKGNGVVTFDSNSVVSSHTVMRFLGDIYPKENVLSVIAWNKLYKKELFENESFKEGIIHEDEFLIHHIVGKSFLIALIADDLYHYRIREGSITARSTSQNLRHIDYLDALKNRVEYCRGMMFGDLLIYMLYSYFEGMKQLMVRYSEETLINEKLFSVFRKRAFDVYFHYFGILDSFQKRDYLKLIICPQKYRNVVIEAMNN